MTENERPLPNSGGSNHGDSRRDGRDREHQPQQPDSSHATTERSQWDVLILNYLEADKSEEVSAQFRELLPNTQFRQLLAKYAADSAALYEFCLPTDLFRLEDDLQRAHAGSADERPLVERPKLLQTKSSPWHSSGRLQALACIAVAIAVTVTVVFYLFGRTSSERDFAPSQTSLFVCSIEEVVGEVRIAGELARNRQQLAAGLNLRTVGALSSAKLVFDDGTMLQLAGDALARVHTSEGQKQVFLDYGHAAANVRPQRRGKPLSLFTPTASLEVVGTQFAVSALSQSTQLNVSEGVVMLKPRGGGESVPVKDGQFSEVRLAEILPPFETAEAPDRWSQDFNDGLPSDWGWGVWVPEGADDSSQGAVRAALFVDSNASKTHAKGEPHVDFYQVWSEKKWGSGLVRVREDSQLSFRIKMDRPEWYQVFLGVRAEPLASGAWSSNYEFQEGARVEWSEVEPGAWREVTIPLTEFKRVPPFGEDEVHPLLQEYEPFELRPGGPPPVGGLVVWILFSTQADRGMTVDDIVLGPRDAARD